jgi:hypothetical protein
MGHGHPHDHDDEHPHDHAHEYDMAADPSVPDSELSPLQLSRRGLLRSAGSPQVTFTHDFGRVDGPFYARIRATDGNRVAAGYLGASVDPAGPAIDGVGDADPWTDLWFYTNPIFVVPR